MAAPNTEETKEESKNNNDELNDDEKSGFIDLSLSQSAEPPPSKSTPRRKLSAPNTKPQSYNCFDSNCTGTILWKNRTHYVNVKGVVCGDCGVSCAKLTFSICSNENHQYIRCTKCFFKKVRQLH